MAAIARRIRSEVCRLTGANVSVKSPPRPLDLSAPATAATATVATTAATTATAIAAPLLLLQLRLLLLLPSLSQPLPPRMPPSLPAMTSLRRSGGSGDGGGGSSGSGGGRPSSRCGAVRWGFSGGGQMWVQKRQHEALTPQQLCEWYTSRGGGGGSSGGRSAAVQLGVTGGGLPKLQQRPRKSLSPQQLREWYVQRGASRGSARCPYVIRTSDWAGQTCGTVGHTQSRRFSCLSDTWRAEFGDATELPRWLELVRQGVDIFNLDNDAILTAMYTLSASAEGDCYRCVPPDPGIVAAALGASGSGTLPGTTSAEALHTFTLDSGASRCFFRDSTTLTPLPAPVRVRLADPSGGPVVARSSNVLPCPAVPSGSLSGLHLPSFSTNLVSTAALQDAMVTTTTPRGSSLYTLATKPPQVAASAQVSTSGQVAASSSCRLLSHQTLLWHHRLGHPSLPRLRGMHSRLLVSGLPMSLPPLPPSPTKPCLPCVEGRQRAAPHSSSFPPTTAPLQTLHMDVWGPARVSGKGRERYFLLVVDEYMRYTTVFPLRSKGEVSDVLIPWICTVRLQLRERFRQDLSVLRLHSIRGDEFSSDLLQDFCRGEGILQPFTLPDSPQQNGIAKRRIGLVMEVARTSMIHAAAPHFLWPFAFRYAAHQLNLWPCVSLSETSPTLRWTGEVGDASVFRVSSSRSFVCDTSADKLSARDIPNVFLGFVPDALGWQFYHPTSRGVLLSHDVTFDESVPFYRLFPYPSAPPPPPPLVLAPGPPPLSAQVLLQVLRLGVELGGAGSEGAGSGGAGPGGEEPGGPEPEGVEPGGAESEGVESRGAAPRGAASSGGSAGASPRLSSQQQWEWLVRCAHRRSGASGAGGPGDTRAGGAGVTAGAGGAGGTAATRPVCARASGAGAAGTGCVGGAGAGDLTEPGAAGARGAGVGGSGAGGAGAAVGATLRFAFGLLSVCVHACMNGMVVSEPLGAVSIMAGPEEMGGRGAGGSGEAHAQGQPCDSAMASVQPSLGPPRDEPRVFGLDKFNGDNFAKWSFKMENIFDHYDLLEVMEVIEKRPENDPQKNPWVRKSAQGYLLLGQVLGSSQIRHIKPFQREPEKGPKAWAALKGVHAPATAAVAVVLERQMAALRIEEDEAVEDGVHKLFSLRELICHEDEEEADLAATTSLEAAGVADTAATTRTTDAVAADSTASATIVTRADICGAIATSSLMDGVLLKAKRVEEQEEGEEEAVEAMAVAEVVLQAPLDEVVMDVVGPLKLGAAGAEYFLTIVDDWKAENEAKIGMRFGEVKSFGLEHVELPLKLSSSSTTTRQSSLVNGGEEAKDAEEKEEEVQQKRQGLHVPAAEEEGRGKRRIQAPNRLTYDALGKPAKSALARAALMVGDDEESDYEECAFAFFSPVEMPGELATLKEALESSDAEEWKKTTESELKSIKENGTWELVELPEGRKAITSKWLFKIKSDAEGKIERYKSRLVAKGYQQKEKVDYKELFSPVVKPTTLRTLLAGAAIKEWVVKQMDVTTAFLNGILEEEIFMAQPEGFDDVLEEIGFTPSSADHSLFMLGEEEQRSFMVVYVDDILIFSFYLGLHIERDVEKRCMRVHQRKYREALAANFGQSEGHVATTFPSRFKCVKGPEEESVGEEERRRFHSLVGSLMYAVVNTRSDVTFAT
ncbi:unnamed protein product [Closterium sp. NIES-53]